MEPEFAEMAANLGRNLQEGRVRIIQAVVAKARAAQRSGATFEAGMD
jgi:hypothetical protein